MLVVYTTRTSPRIRYATGLLLGNLLGLEWRLTSDLTEYRAHDGPRLFYGADKPPTGGLNVPAHPFLLERGVHYFVPQLEYRAELPVLFPCGGQAHDMAFDPFAASFYLVSRYEEYLPHKKDVHGRFEASESFAYKNNFLHQAVVNRYALLLKKLLQAKYPALSIRSSQFRFLPTYDIDIAYAYRARTLFRSLFGMLRSLGKLEMSKLWQRIRVLTGSEKDPYDTYELQLNLHKESGIRAHYFFLCGDYGPYDKNVAFYSRPFSSLVKMLGDYAVVGIHPSYASSSQEELLARELPRLEAILNREIFHSRQHFLKLHFPGSYQTLLKHDIRSDYTMGYASQPGFRASICSPYSFYDLELERESPLTIVPFSVMDGSLRDYLSLTPKDSLPLVSRLMDEVQEVGGMFSTLWHNDTLCECEEWKGWRELYVTIYRMAAERHLAARGK